MRRGSQTTLKNALRCRLTRLICAGLMLISTAQAEEKPIAWLQTREEGLRDAQINKRPMLIRFGADYCPYCRKLEAELAHARAAQPLKKWTLVEIDIERQPEVARAMGVQSIPALRVVSPTGRVMATHDGLLTDDKLIDWLDNAFDRATAELDEALTSDGPPSAIDLQRILRRLAERDPSLREAAVRRLLPYPVETAGEVLTILREEKLAARLAALELFREWQAPIEGMDPWSPETMTAERFQQLDSWLKELAPIGDPDQALSPKLRAQIRSDIEHLLTADPATSLAIRERLARYGQALLPDVALRLKKVSTDDQRARLVALRYRLVMPAAMALTSAGLVDRLADPNVETRHQALRELTEQAAAETQPLFLELFADPDPFVRELSLFGLRAVAGDEGAGALVKLLDDPEPNVRAAVLKVFAEHPLPGLENRLAEFMETETDPDLLVHAIRCYRNLSARSAEVLIGLLKHPDWRVRAESIDAMTGAWQRYPDAEAQRMASQTEVTDAIAERLQDDDAFVVSRALLGVKKNLTSKSLKLILKLPERNPALMPDVIDTISQSSGMKAIVLPRLREYLQSTAPEIRAQAIRGLGQVAPDEIHDQLLAALEDGDAEVRIAGARTLTLLLKHYQPTFNDGSWTFRFGTNRNDEDDDFDEPVPAEAAPPVDSETPAKDEISSTEAPVPVDGEPVPAVVDPAEPGSDLPATAETEPAPPAARKRKAKSGGLFSNLLNGLFGGGQAEEAPEAMPRDVTEQEEDHPERDVANSEKRDAWVTKFAAGKGRPAWASETVPALQAMLKSDHQAERMASAIPLVALGQTEPVLSKLPELIHQNETDSALLDVLEWLPQARRAAFITDLLTQFPSAVIAAHVIEKIGELHDVRDADVIWRLCSLPPRDSGSLQIAVRSLQTIYLGEQYWNTSRLAPTRIQRVTGLLRQQLEGPRGWQQLVAMNILQTLHSDDDELREAIQQTAQSIVDDESLDPDLRTDAYQVTLAMDDHESRTEKLRDLLRSDEESKQLLALRAFLNVNGGIGLLAKSQLSLSVHDLHADRSVTPGEPLTPEPPAGLDVDAVRPLLASKQPELQALAGYVLAVSGDPSGLTPMLDYWRKHVTDDVTRLTYRAIAATDDGSYLPVLQQIYRSLDQWEVREFYWTIRIMTGPRVLAFRAQIRKEKPDNLH